MNTYPIEKGDRIEPVLSVIKLNFGYGQRPVLQDITFSVERDTICGLLGPNASGKTTLLKCIDGVLTPKDGSVQVEGNSVRRLGRRDVARLMAVVPQQTTVVFSFTALQMVVMGRAARLTRFRLPSARDYSEAEAAMDGLGIAALAERFFNELSGGEKQLVLLARALFQDTQILLLDEPTSHLDFKNQFMLMDVIRDVTKKKHLTTLVSLHDPNLAARYCDRMVMLKAGRLYKEGSKDAVFEQDTLEQVYGMKVRVENTSEGTSVVVPVRR
ncbi:MAG: ABC transporter ATP-binding protein [Proteobacteria bacterium]|nr:ABC transporter ATP-binding protein [Pseudomonadota bacterium]